MKRKAGGGGVALVATVALLAAWGLWMAWKAGASLRPWLDVLRSYPRGMESLGWHGFPRTLLPEWLAVLAGTAVYLAAILKAGLATARLWIPEGRAAGERDPLAFLGGFSLLASCYLGLALLGLFHWKVLAGAVVLLFLAPVNREAWRAVRTAWSGTMELFRPWALMAFVPFIVALVLMFLPDTNGDAYVLHLAAPEQLLRRHRYDPLGTSAFLQYPLSVELLFAPAVALGRDEAAHFINLAPFLAGLLLLGSWVRREAGKAAAAVALCAALTFGMTGQMMVVAKNDLAAAGFAVAGLVLLARAGRRSGLAGGLLLGMGLASKYSIGVIAAVAVAGMLFRGGKGAGRAAIGAVVPLLPWLAKTWLFTGNPVWPALQGVFHSPFWDRESGEALQTVYAGGGPHGLAAFPASFAGVLALNQLPLALVLPAVLWLGWKAGGPLRWMTGVAVCGTLALWVAVPQGEMRYALPLLAVLAGVGAVTVVPGVLSLRAPVIRRLAYAGTFLCWLPLGSLLSFGVDPASVLPYMAGKTGRAGYLSSRLDSYMAVQGILRGGEGRLATQGDPRMYHLPGPVLSERYLWRTWSWSLAREARTAGELGKRFRQAGIRYLLLNEGRPGSRLPGVSPYQWDARATRIWREFEKGNIREVGRTSQGPNGGTYTLYRISD
jgi:hypothetical protein